MSEWIKHNGGPMPVEKDELVFVLFDNSWNDLETGPSKASSWGDWDWDSIDDISKEDGFFIVGYKKSTDKVLHVSEIDDQLLAEIEASEYGVVSK